MKNRWKTNGKPMNKPMKKPRWSIKNQSKSNAKPMKTNENHRRSHCLTWLCLSLSVSVCLVWLGLVTWHLKPPIFSPKFEAQRGFQAGLPGSASVSVCICLSCVARVTHLAFETSDFFSRKNLTKLSRQKFSGVQLRIPAPPQLLPSSSPAPPQLLPSSSPAPSQLLPSSSPAPPQDIYKTEKEAEPAGSASKGS